MSQVKQRDSARNAIKRQLEASKKENANYDKLQIEAFLKVLEEQWVRFNEAQSVVEETCGSESIQLEESERKQGEDWYVAACSNFNRMLTSQTQSTPPAAPNQGDSLVRASLVPHIKLPAFDLPRFSGDPTTWMPFHDSFTAIVDRNDSLTGSQKLHYLRCCLTGEPSQLISNFKLQDTSYAEAWQLIKSRYYILRVIKDHHIAAIFSVQKANADSAVAIKKVLDPILQNVRALKALVIPVEFWDDWLVYFTVSKLSEETRRHWELSLQDDESPSLEDLKQFLETRCRALEVLNSPAYSSKSVKTPTSSRNNKSRFCHSAQTQKPNSKNCFYCSGQHRIYECTQFRNIPVESRVKLVRSKHSCENCLSIMHSSQNCRSASTCKICKHRHHTLQHSPTVIDTATITAAEASVASCSQNSDSSRNVASTSLRDTANSLHAVAAEQLTLTATPNIDKPVLLATALVRAYDYLGNQHILRALFDTGSHSSFISGACVQALRLPRKQSNVIVTGIGCSKGNTRGQTSLLISPLYQNKSYDLSALIFQKLTGLLPTSSIRAKKWPHIANLDLADPKFNEPSRIDLIIGSDEMPKLLESAVIKGPPETPMAQKTVFGWVLFGRIDNDNQAEKNSICLYTDIDLTKAATKSWELEEYAEKQYNTPEEAMCEDLFNNTHERDAQGRFIVRLPFKPNCRLGESRSTAVQSWLRMERQLSKNEDHRVNYHAFLQEMLDQDHMEPVNNMPPANYYMPHLSVFKDTSETTKTRVVFNASQKTSNGVSLNDALLVGPRLQQDLVSILNRFQTHKYALIADVKAMYRQIRIAEEHIDYQRIVWRKTPMEPLQDFRMLRVTYGVASSAHHAVKSLQQTAKAAQAATSLASSAILNDFYMDDLLTGSNCEYQLDELRRDISSMLSEGCFELRKYASNSSRVLQNIPLEIREKRTTHLLAEDENVRALGLMWDSKEDCLYFVLNLGPQPATFTKRTLLSDSCRLFDPTGKLAPITVVPKMIFQRLWQLDLGWDDPVPKDTEAYWLEHRKSLLLLSQLKIPRWLGTGIEGSKTALHCFADASELAYAAVVYARTQYSDGSIKVAMVGAKTKVAPLRSISIAKLELCAAVLATTLGKQVQQSFGIVGSNIHGWTDSLNALAWLQSHPSKWSLFVAYRVAKAQLVIPAENWSYVASDHNPADCASRGLQTSKLLKHSLWWNGPSWLSLPVEHWPSHPFKKLSTDLEIRIRKRAVHTATITSAWELCTVFSSFTHLKRITALCKRFIFNLNCKRNKLTHLFKTGPLISQELKEVETFWIKQIQTQFYQDEINHCQQGIPVPIRSALAKLNIFLDENGVLRAGGRICHSAVSADTKFPIILPAKSSVAEIIIGDLHKFLLHAGPQLMQAALQRRFWIIGARNLVRKVYRSCVICRRQSRAQQEQMMANLPSYHVNLCHPFYCTGVDMAGPFPLKFSKGRGAKTTKGYVAVFICMATGAMHLELAGDLSAETFICVLKRFISRRGYCRTYVSDNGKNFVGAERELQALFQQAMSNASWQKYLADSNIEWKFNPPSAPHMGGYWETAVKRVKFHLKRALSSTLLTYEEFSTVLAETEACVNSRPLCPLPSDACDLEVLTPGHFLINEPLKVLPEPEKLDFVGSLHQRWQLLSQIRRHFWHRWHKEYLVTLQQRSKWLRPHVNVQIGDLVIINEENIPPAKWRMARVTKCFPGDDGKVRVVEHKVAEGILKRPVVKIVPILPEKS